MASLAATAFLMIALRLQHPPSAALAVSLVLEPNFILMGVSVMVCIIVLSLFKAVVNRWLARHCD